MPLTINDLVEKFKRPILVNKNGCWIWKGSISSQGYALFNHQRVHTLVAAMVGKERSEGEVICHVCGAKPCVNPNHLYIGTYSDNLVDSILNGDRKVTEKDYRRMVTLKDNGYNYAMIARELDISRQMVWLFFQGRMMCFKPNDFIKGGKNA